MTPHRPAAGKRTSAFTTKQGNSEDAFILDEPARSQVILLSRVQNMWRSNGQDYLLLYAFDLDIRVYYIIIFLLKYIYQQLLSYKTSQ